MTEIIATGHSVIVTVRRGCLMIKDATGERRIERVPRVYDRLVIHCNIGYLTFEAATWMRDHGMEWSYIRSDRGILGASVGGQGNPELWRKQVTADPFPVVRFLLAAKLDGQARNTELLRNPDVAKRIRGYAERTAFGTAHAEITGREGKAAEAYWAVWSDVVTVPFVADEMLRVPPRWIRFQQRKTLAGVGKISNRNATDPVNAMLNYAYKVGETLCAEACYAVGLSPVIGLSHNRQYVRRRDGDEIRQSMALDLLEAIRPACDRVILELLDYGQGVRPYLKWMDFLELDSGVVRVESETLRERIISECSALRGETVEYARQVAAMLGA